MTLYFVVSTKLQEYTRSTWLQLASLAPWVKLFLDKLVHCWSICWSIHFAATTHAKIFPLFYSYTLVLLPIFSLFNIHIILCNILHDCTHWKQKLRQIFLWGIDTSIGIGMYCSRPLLIVPSAWVVRTFVFSCLGCWSTFCVCVPLPLFVWWG